MVAVCALVSQGDDGRQSGQGALRGGPCGDRVAGAGQVFHKTVQSAFLTGLAGVSGKASGGWARSALNGWRGLGRVRDARLSSTITGLY
jgi:hypothetical protein